MRRFGAACTAVVALTTAALALATPATGAPPAHSPAVAGGSVTSLTMTPASVAVDGLTGTAIAHIAVTASDTNGAIGACTNSDMEVSWRDRLIVFLRPVGTGPADPVRVDLFTHTTQPDGEHWSGDWRIASTRTGTWHVSGLWWCAGLDDFAVAPASLGLDPTITVTGTHVPTVTYVHSPRIAAYDAHQWLVATYRGSSGRPLAGYRVVYGEDTMCGFDGDGIRSVTTDSRGRVVVRLIGSVFQCLYLAYPGGLPWTARTTILTKQYIDRYTWYRRVSGSVSTSSVRLGRSVTVRGSIYPVGNPVSLQRLVGRTWRTVATTTVRLSGRVAFTYAPTVRGLAILRLLARGDPYRGYLAPTPSRSLRIVVT